MGRAWQKLGHPAAAVEQYERGAAQPGGARPIWPARASASSATRRLWRCNRTLTEINPDNALTHTNLDSALYHWGRAEEALQSIERAGPRPGPGIYPCGLGCWTFMCGISLVVVGANPIRWLVCDDYTQVANQVVRAPLINRHADSNVHVLTVPISHSQVIAVAE